ncbi:enterobactin synthase subunit F [Klebsiella pneumoniae]|uniref:Enterobactin synthase subunit F n=1 Tax=Klebsiella pneumoniae TaxID=573 RepID=A0A378CD15_KLEPN|nr:enterobactin synthase subunit F [Klebsiella pneumoniae]
MGKLSALLAADLSDEQAQRLGLDTLLPLRESDGPTLFCFHPASGFAWQFSVLARYSQPALVDYRYSVAAPAGADG